MPFNDWLLYKIARRFPNPRQAVNDRIGAPLNTDEFQMGYALLEQFNVKVRKGVQIPVAGKDVLEIGCGPGGISCFLAVAGARSVVGIDLDTRGLEYARRFAKEVAAWFGDDAALRVDFQEMNAYELTFPPESFDLVVADNAFEHFVEPALVMRNAHRVLRPGGGILVPVFSSIYSKYGLHLKNGLKMPWANLFFSEPTILRALRRMAADDPFLFELYPGLKEAKSRVRDVRRYKDLNDITFRKFKRMAGEEGFRVAWFRPLSTPAGELLRFVPGLKSTILADIFSQGASAYLVKEAKT
jgi:SAM-dependent methyltransferase